MTTTQPILIMSDRIGGFLYRRQVARDIHRLAMDRLRNQNEWRNGVYAFDKRTGIVIVFAKGIGGDILEMHLPTDRGIRQFAIDRASLKRTRSTPLLLQILEKLKDTNPAMSLHEYSHPSREVGELISGPPAR